MIHHQVHIQSERETTDIQGARDSKNELLVRLSGVVVSGNLPLITLKKLAMESKFSFGWGGTVSEILGCMYVCI